MDQIWLKAVQAGMSRDALLADIPMRVQKEGHTASIGDSDISLNNLAGLLKGTNRSGEAEPLVRRALAIDEEVFGANHPKVATDLNNLAVLLQASNRLTEAESLMRRALVILNQNFGETHPNVASALNNLAELLRATNRLREAEPLMRRTVVIFLDFTRHAGHPHPHLNYILNNYRELLLQMGLSQQQVVAKLNELGREYGLRFGAS